MGAGELLRDLDSRVLPPLARRISRLGADATRLRVLTGVALLSVAAVLATALWTLERAAVGDAQSPDLMTVGVVDGQSVPGYVRNSRSELAALVSPSSPGGAVAPAETYALVSLSAYFAPDRLAGVLGGVAVAEVYTRAPLTGLPTQVLRIPVYRLPQDVVAGMLDAARRRDREQAEYRRLAARLDRTGAGGDGSGSSERLLTAYATAAQIASAEATAYRSRCSCVFAAVVRATPAGLTELARRTGVRAVDPAPEVHRLDLAEFRPLLPEQQTTVPESLSPVASLLPVPPGGARRTGAAPAPAGPQAPSSIPASVTSTSPDSPAATSEPSVESSAAPTAVPSALSASPSVSAAS